MHKYCMSAGSVLQTNAASNDDTIALCDDENQVIMIHHLEVCAKTMTVPWLYACRPEEFDLGQGLVNYVD